MKPLLACIAVVVIATILGCGGDTHDGPAAPGLTTGSAPVAAPITADPDRAAGRVRGTVVMVHGGGWRGHDARAQQILTRIPGRTLLGLGWRIISIDTNEGQRGLQDVLDAAGAELERRTSNGPLCLYGESSGAHLALVAAARLRAIDCVIGLGTPTDPVLYEREAAGSSVDLVRSVDGQIRRFFGTTAGELAPWNPVALASRIRASVLLLREGDDPVVSAAQARRFRAAKPEAHVLELQVGDPAVAADRFVHGTISAGGRRQYAAAIAAFLDRARSVESR